MKSHLALRTFPYTYSRGWAPRSLRANLCDNFLQTHIPSYKIIFLVSLQPSRAFSINRRGVLRTGDFMGTSCPQPMQGVLRLPHKCFQSLAHGSSFSRSKGMAGCFLSPLLTLRSHTAPAPLLAPWGGTHVLGTPLWFMPVCTQLGWLGVPLGLCLVLWILCHPTALCASCPPNVQPGPGGCFHLANSTFVKVPAGNPLCCALCCRSPGVCHGSIEKKKYHEIISGRALEAGIALAG